MTSTRLIIVLGLAALMLTACGGLREDLGLGRDSPDEFAVVDRPPLSMPPDFTLRPPEPGAPRPQDVSTAAGASTALFGAHAEAMPQKEGDGSSIEQTLLAKTDASAALPDIRAIVDRENAQQVGGSQHLVDRLLWWKKEPSPGIAVDAPAEAARIKAAKEKGEPINKGATPVIERQKTGWLNL